MPTSSPAGGRIESAASSGRDTEVEYLCELDLAEERMSSGLGRRSLFDEFFSDDELHFDVEKTAEAEGAQTAEPAEVS